METNVSKISGPKKVVRGIGIIICIFLTLIIIVNVTMIVKSYIYPNKVPDFIGYKPLIVLSGSMEPTILTGDLILVKEADAEDIAQNDIIAFRNDANTETVVTHRVTEVLTENGEVSFLTKGDANTGADASQVKAEELEGKYIGRVSGLGRFAIFLQTPIGMLIFVVTPLCLFILYDMVVRKRRSNKKATREAELEAELEVLRAAQKEENESKIEQ